MIKPVSRFLLILIAAYFSIYYTVSAADLPATPETPTSENQEKCETDDCSPYNGANESFFYRLLYFLLLSMLLVW